MAKQTVVPAPDTEALRARLAEVSATEAAIRAEREANKAVRVKAADKPLVECGDGCGALVKARFLPGHDAKLKSALLNAAHGTDTNAAEAALATLVSLGWDRFFVPRKGK